MAYDPHGNLSYGAVAVVPSPAASGTSLTLSAGQGADFPAPGAQGYNVTIWPAGVAPLRSNAEIARVTAKVGDVLTIVRAQEGTSARTILVGDQIANTITAKVFEDIETAIPLASQFVAATAVFNGTNASGTIASNAISVSVGPGGAALKGSGTYTQRSGTIEFSNSNGVTFGLSQDGVMTASVQTNYQTPGAYLTTARASNDAIGLNTAQTNVTWTVNSSGLSLNAGGYAGTNGAITGGSITVNTSGVSVNLPAYLSTQSTQFLALTLGGNTAGVTTFHASNNASLFFHGGNNITLSGNGSSVTISGANAGGAQTAISGIVASDATYTSGTVTFTGVGGGVTVNSNTGQRVDISVAAPVAQTVQTQNMVAVSLSGNTSGALALVSSGTAILAGGNNITLSQNGQSITISGANVGGAQTGISGLIVSDATYTSGTVSFSNAGNVTISSSVDGASQYIRLSVHAPQTGISSVIVSDATYTSGMISFSNQANVTINSSVNGGTQYIRLSGNAAQTNQSAIEGFGVSNTGQTAGNTGISTGVDWVLAGSGSITLSQSTAAGTNTVWIQHPAWITTATQSTQFLAMTLGGNTAGTTTFHATNNASLFLNGGNNITLSGNGSTVTISAAAQTNQSAIEGFGVSNTGATAGNTGISTGVDWVLAGSNLLTLSQSTAAGTNTIWIQHPEWLTTQSAQFLALTLGGNSAGTSTFHASNNVSLFLHGGNNITLSGNGSSVTISGPNVGGAQTGISGIVVSDTTYTSGTVSFSNAGNITISSSVNGATQYIRLSGNAAQTNQSAIRAFGVSNTGQTAGNTGVSTGVDWVLAGSGSITMSQSTAGGGPNTVWVQHPAWITTATQSTQFLALTLGGNSAGTSTFHATNNASLFLNGGNNITLSGNGSTVTVVGPTQSNQSLGLYAVSNTTGESSSSTFDARTLSFHGAGIASVGYSNGSVVVSVPSGGGGLTNIRVSAGTTSNLLSALTFADSNGISFGINASTITAQANTVGTATTVTPVASANSVGTVTRWAAEDHRHAGIGGIGISTSGNTAGTTGSNVGTYWFQGGNNITVSQITSNNGSHTIVVSAAGGPDLMFYDNAPVAGTTLSNPGQMTLYVFPFTPVNEVFPGNMSVSTVFLNVTQSVSTAATWTNQFSIAFYSSVNSTQLTRVFSGSSSWGTNAGNMNINDSFGGTRWLTIHSSNFDVAPVFSNGVRYWCAMWHRTSNNAGSMSFNLYGYQTFGTSAARSGVMGVGSVNNSSLGWGRFHGIYSATFSSAMPQSLGASDINKSVAQVIFLPHVILNNVGTNIV